MKQKQFSTRKTFFFTTIIIFAFFGSLELAARVYISWQQGSAQYMIRDPKTITLGYRLQSFSGDDGVVYYKTVPSKSQDYPVNSLGLLGPEIGSKRNNRMRIVCLGGSTTYGTSLPYRESYPALLQVALDETRGKGYYEVINAGQPGLGLAQINSLVKYEIVPLVPDIVVLLSINNNLYAPGYWYVSIDDPQMKTEEKQAISIFNRLLMKVRRPFVEKTAFGFLLQRLFAFSKVKYLTNFDWAGFSQSLMSDDKWGELYSENLSRLLHTLQQANPDVRLLLIEQAVNTEEFSCMSPPFERAWDILRGFARRNENVFALDVHTAVIAAARKGEDVWQDVPLDPLHLTAHGNAILAKEIADFILMHPDFQ